MYRALFAVLVLLSGCADELAPTAPRPDADAAAGHEWLVDVTPMDESMRPGPDPSGRYPLQLGNVWKYRAHVTVHTIPADGEPSDEEIIRTTKSEITGASDWFDRCYVDEERTISETIGDETLGDPFTQYVHYRQDRAGLYEVADTGDGPVEGSALRSDGESAFALELRKQRNPQAWQNALAAIQERVQPLYDMRCGRRGPRGSALDGELTRLKYPLHRKQEWVVIDDAFFMSATVERRVVLDLPVGRTPAWKIRIESSLFGPDDVIHMFYGRDGYLGWQVSVIGQVIDTDGQLIGTVHFVDEEYLEEHSIDRRADLPCEPAKPTGKNEGGIESD